MKKGGDYSGKALKLDSVLLLCYFKLSYNRETSETSFLKYLY